MIGFLRIDPLELKMIREGKTKEDNRMLSRRAALQRVDPHSDKRAPN
jgi:hypothetical protein